MPNPNPPTARRPDLATILGGLVAILCIVGGLLLEGGKVTDILQITAAMIVLGGTAGAVLISTPVGVLRDSLRRLVSVFREDGSSGLARLEEILGYANQARKQGIVSLEQSASNIEDPFLRKALNLAVDGTDLQELRQMMDIELRLAEERAEAEAKVFESAGGYSPTIGIIGAVLGLIQVMKHLEDIREVGHGIAVAFVATVCGVAFANLFCLPVAQKIRARAQLEMQVRELMLEGVIGIVEGLNPKLVRLKLEAFLPAATLKDVSPQQPRKQGRAA